MKEVFTIEKEFVFNNNIYEITSISIEHNYDVAGSICQGEFIISGDYRLHEVSINKEDFNFKVPFQNDIRSNVNLDSVEVTINDFSYDLKEDTLSINVEYLVEGEQSLIEFAEETDLDEFLQNNEAEIIDLSSEEVEDEREEEKPVVILKPEVEEIEEEREEIIEEREEIKEEEEKEVIEEDKRHHIDKNTIVDSINSEESFVTYNVHTVTASDTIDNICEAYKINLNDLKKFNEFEELTLNMKLIIPDEED